MLSSEELLAPAAPSWFVRRAGPFLALAVAGAVALTFLVAGGPVGAYLVRVLAAGVAVWFAYDGRRMAVGRERAARGWMTVAMGVWLISELSRLVGSLVGQPILVAELSLAGLGLAAIATYVTAARGRMRSADEAALYLDAAAVFFGLVAAVAVVGASFLTDHDSLVALAHTAFFVGMLAATLLLDLSVRVPMRFAGPWEILVGLGLGAAGYVGLLVTADNAPVSLAMHAVVAGGALLVGHGGGRWSAAEDRSLRYGRIADSLRAVLPLGSVLVTAAIGVLLISNPQVVPGLARIGVAMAVGVVAVAVMARQTLLLVDRERVLRREHELSDELTVAEAQYRSVVERVPGVVYVAEAGQHGRWHFVSPKIVDLLGYTAAEWMADPTLWINRMHPADRERMILAETGADERLEPKGRWEYRLTARDGRVVWVLDDEAVIARDADGRPTMVQGILVDISDRKDLEDQLRHQALHDPLTGLPNRVLFVDRLSHALVRRARSEAGLAVMFVDLDDFKEVNDRMGHAVGDELLRLVAIRLRGVLRAEDTACRLGGDEFAFLLEDADTARAEIVAGRILAALGQPFELGGQTASLSASIGIAARSGAIDDASSTVTADELLRDADTAMYAAKALGKGRVRVFDRRMHEPATKRRELSVALECALANDELFIEYQPIVDLRNGARVGLEALVRWNHPQLGRLMPADFVPLAEESRLIRGLGEWVLRRACADLAAGDTMVSVNVSAHQLGGGELPLLVEAALAESLIKPSRLLLELTESTIASAGAGAESELLAIQKLGVRIALDDFGSGYSSLEYLGRLPIDILKIDRSLVEQVHAEPQRQEVLLAIGHIAEKLGLGVIVEGVELEAQRTALLELGFRHAQGFLFSRPVPLTEVLAPVEIRRAS